GNAGYNIPNEGFFSGASYDDVNNAIWANSYFDANFPAEGYCYRLDAATGAAVGGVNPQPSVRSRRATPVIDQNQIYVPAFTKWAAPSYNGFAVFSRSTGFRTGNLDGYITGDRQYNDGVLTCEQGADDWFILGTELGQLNFFRMGLDNQYVFTRQTTLSGANGGQWNGGSMAPDLVAFTNLGGITVALAPGADRPRLDIITNPIFELVEFGSLNPTSIVFAEAFTNNGCADLTVNSVTLDDVAPTAFGDKIELTTVDPALMKKMDEFASFTTNAERFAKVGLMYGEQSGELSPDYRYVKSTGSSLNYRAASAFPAVVNGAEGASGVYSPLPGTIVAPGEVVDIDVAINGPLVTRGPHPFFAILDTDDPDFFMDDPSQLPAIQLVPVGGCLEDSVRIYFGVGSPNANSTTVYNNANLARFTGNGAHDIDINGFTEGATTFCSGTLTELFGGLRGYSLTPRRIAMTGQSWDGDDYETLLADPNYCTNECAAGYQTGVLLAEYSDDGGASYTQVFGDVAAVSYVDSAQDYSDGGGGWSTTD
ncbi:MAG TPA: hypothetical protein VLB27_00215, partial [candidate division Zixibacteria bacterium]|nr:hypothetical protein [candidate division Zixibacteria bacterium]